MRKTSLFLFACVFLAACQTKTTEATTSDSITEPATEIVSTPTANTTPDNQKPTDDVEAIVAKIRERYQNYLALDKDKKLQKRTLTYMCDVFEGNVQYVLNQENELLWIEHTWGGDHFHLTHQYFLHEGKLFFYFIKEGSWNFDGENYDENSEVSHTVDTFVEKRHYFDANENAVRCLNKEYKVFSAKKENPKTENVANKTVTCPDTKAFFERLKKLQEALPTQKQSKTDCIEGIEN